MKNKQVAIIVLLVLLGVVTWWFMAKNNEVNEVAESNTQQTTDELPTDDPTQPIPEGSATNQLPANTDAIAALDQVAGTSVTIDNYVISQPGYIVIHEVASNGSAGAIIGQSGLLAAGRGQDLEVRANISANKSYIAMLHYDNGDKKFNASQDQPAMNGSNMITAKFSAVE